MTTECPECGSESVESIEDDSLMCLDCGHELSKEEAARGGRFAGYKVGLILEAGKLPGKDKLFKLKVDVGAGQPLQIVTNAPNVKEGLRVVIATVGAVLGDPEDAEIVQKGNVGGCQSEGIVCDGEMLGWGTANKGRAVVLPESFDIGSPPPLEKPRTR